ncbi:PMT_2 domain-containing protein [Thermococcus nautili]|uniref:ArnT family glycosyltransferase n=1 Tax=Thermococcus nautili TaxID=195522 RepID=UPI0025547650|nr:glycosyltransferase family 39 protein [Thermococcus nautili]CAI1493912.1 PMT_2 domain-containing protein [Thermococcus nautili]
MRERDNYPPSILLLLLGLLAFLFLRVPLLIIQNAYVDYDEGTYLLFARLINHGILPYRDIFAVHPPLYYYALALWLRIFGDSYVVGRMFSLVLGAASLILAYFTGCELLDKRLGIAFALLIALDPLMISMNTLVLHESMIEFFTLLSLWFLAKYLNNNDRRFAYASLFVASIGSSAKFTIIPYLVALYVFLLFKLSSKEKVIHSFTKRILTFDQGAVIMVAYLLWTGIMVAIVTLFPSSLVRILAIVPGIHAVDKFGHIYTSLMFLFFWLGTTVYLYRIRYVNALVGLLRDFPRVIPLALKLGAILVMAKAIVEVPLGILVSNDYINQTYFAQSGRSFPFIGIFWMVNKVIATLQSNNLERISYLLPLFLLFAAVILTKKRNGFIEISEDMNSLLLLNIMFYLVVIPIIPNIRLLYSMILVAYIAMLYPLMSAFKDRTIAGYFLLALIILASVDAGITLNYPRGKLAIPSTPHMDELRDDLGKFIKEKNLTGVYLSVNPMDAYYLNLAVDPYIIDNFGLGYLKGVDLVNLTINHHPNYVIFDTWMFAAMNRSKALFNVYNPLFRFVLYNGTLLFGESKADSEVVELFSMFRTDSPFKVDTLNGAIRVYFSDESILNLTPLVHATTLRVTLVNETTYSVSIVSTNSTIYEGFLWLGQSNLTISVPNVQWRVSSEGVFLSGNHPIENGNFTGIKLCTSKACIFLKGDIEYKGDTLKVSGELTLLPGYHRVES